MFSLIGLLTNPKPAFIRKLINQSRLIGDLGPQEFAKYQDPAFRKSFRRSSISGTCEYNSPPFVHSGLKFQQFRILFSLGAISVVLSPEFLPFGKKSIMTGKRISHLPQEPDRLPDRLQSIQSSRYLHKSIETEYNSVETSIFITQLRCIFFFKTDTS